MDGSVRASCGEVTADYGSPTHYDFFGQRVQRSKPHAHRRREADRAIPRQPTWPIEVQGRTEKDMVTGALHEKLRMRRGRYCPAKPAAADRKVVPIHGSSCADGVPGASDHDAVASTCLRMQNTIRTGIHDSRRDAVHDGTNVIQARRGEYEKLKSMHVVRDNSRPATKRNTTPRLGQGCLARLRAGPNSRSLGFAARSP